MLIRSSRFYRRTVAEIQEKALKRSGRSRVTRFLHSRDDKDAIAGWKSDLNRILHVFNVCSTCSHFAAATNHCFQTELAMNTHTIVADIRQDMSKLREGACSQDQAVSGIRTLIASLIKLLPRLRTGQQFRLSRGPASNTFVQRARGTAASAVKDFLWT